MYVYTHTYTHKNKGGFCPWSKICFSSSSIRYHHRQTCYCTTNLKYYKLMHVLLLYLSFQVQMLWWKTLWVISVIKKAASCFLFAMLSDFLFIDTHSKFRLSDRTLQNAKVGESFQVEGNWVCKTDTDWFSKCQAVILSNKSHNHNRRGSLSSSCWKRRYFKKRCFIYFPVLPASIILKISALLFS